MQNDSDSFGVFVTTGNIGKPKKIGRASGFGMGITRADVEVLGTTFPAFENLMPSRVEMDGVDNVEPLMPNRWAVGVDHGGPDHTVMSIGRVTGSGEVTDLMIVDDPHETRHAHAARLTRDWLLGKGVPEHLHGAQIPPECADVPEVDIKLTASDITATTKKLDLKWTLPEQEGLEASPPSEDLMRYWFNSAVRQYAETSLTDYANHPKLGRDDIYGLSHGSVVVAMTRRGRAFGHYMLIAKREDSKLSFVVLRASNGDVGKDMPPCWLELWLDAPDFGCVVLVDTVFPGGPVEPEATPRAIPAPCLVTGVDPGAHKPVGHQDPARYGWSGYED